MAKMNLSESKKEQLASMIRQDSYRFDILKVVRNVPDQELWVAGGFVRNLVWDNLHGFKHRSELGDVDVFFFDNIKLHKDDESTIRFKLLEYLPNVNWSVKNQACMHLHDNNNPYSSLSDALTKFPETASAIAVRLNEKNKIEVLAPLGLTDLFELKVRPTPIGKTNKLTYQRYLFRQKEKNWKKIWNRLDIEK